MAKKKRQNRKKKSSPQSKKPIRSFLLIVFGAATVVAIIFLFTLDVFVREKFSGTKWALPSHVYGRALELYEGAPLHRSDLIWELQKLGYRSVERLTGAGQYQVTRQALHFRSRKFSSWDGEQPSRHVYISFNNSGIAKIRDGEKKTIALTRLEPLLIGGIYPAHREDREPVKLESLPPFLVESLIAVEDRAFYQHRGISLRGIARAFIGNIRSGRFDQGGSTITQQLVKNFYLNHQRTLLRKGVEAIMAVLLELHYSKGEILEAYINEIYLGQSGNHGIHGFGKASRYYFNQPLIELELHQIALLTAIAKGASFYDPRRHPQRALQRRNLVIDLLQQQGLIDENLAARSRGKGLDISDRPGTGSSLFPTYLDLVKRQLRKNYRDEDLRSEGLRIFTKFDPQVQRKLENTLHDELSKLESRNNIKKDSLQVAGIVVRVGTGEVVAIAGDRKGGYPGFNRALDAYRPIGSIIKPAVYLTALGRAETYTLSTPIDDGPITVVAESGVKWQPQNFDRRHHGLVPLYDALGQSYNQATARLGMALGIDNVAKTVSALGHQRQLPEVPSLVLGAVAMSPLEVATIYHTIANDGFYSPLGGIESVYTADNLPLKRYPYEIEARFSPATIHLLHYALQVVMREGTGRSAYNIIGDETVLAGKTGTSDDQRDSWFAGFGGNYLTVIWVGRDDNGKMPITGSSGALKLWSQVMAKIGVSSFIFAQPQDIDYRWVNPLTNRQTEESCDGARFLPFIKGSAPVEFVACSGQNKEKIADWLKNIFRW